MAKPNTNSKELKTADTLNKISLIIDFIIITLMLKELYNRRKNH